jgi:hypothetical protein
MGSGSPQRSLNERIPFGMLTQILGRRYEWNQRASSGFNGQPDTVIWRGYCAHVPSPWVKPANTAPNGFWPIRPVGKLLESRRVPASIAAECLVSRSECMHVLRHCHSVVPAA